VGNPWFLYDRLIGEIPAAVTVESVLVGTTWTVVDADGMGLAMTFDGGGYFDQPRLPYAGRPLHELAAQLKSWTLRDASIGMAAVNSHFNAAGRVAPWVDRPLEELRSAGAFSSMLEEMAGKKVAVIGHFPGLQKVADVAELTIFERRPMEGDLPDFAAEYVLPEQDYVFITGTTITNKTLPRLLELSASATVALVGPSVPLAPWWFDMGVDVLAGAVVVDKPAVWAHCQEGGHRGVFGNGALMIDIRRSDLRPTDLKQDDLNESDPQGDNSRPA
jgi:uncharacterized protein (DUF4213/DUF364 family)